AGQQLGMLWRAQEMPMPRGNCQFPTIHLDLFPTVDLSRRTSPKSVDCPIPVGRCAGEGEASWRQAEIPALVGLKAATVPADHGLGPLTIRIALRMEGRTDTARPTARGPN